MNSWYKIIILPTRGSNLESPETPTVKLTALVRSVNSNTGTGSKAEMRWRGINCIIKVRMKLAIMLLATKIPH